MGRKCDLPATGISEFSRNEAFGRHHERSPSRTRSTVDKIPGMEIAVAIFGAAFSAFCGWLPPTKSEE